MNESYSSRSDVLFAGGHIMRFLQNKSDNRQRRHTTANKLANTTLKIGVLAQSSLGQISGHIVGPDPRAHNKWK